MHGKVGWWISEGPPITFRQINSVVVGDGEREGREGRNY